MAFQYQFQMSTLGKDVARGYSVSFPIDWYDEVVLNGPIPVVAFLHGGNGSAVDFMGTTFKIVEWFQGFAAALNPLPKFIAFAPQGVGIDGQSGGDWNAGNLGRSLRLIDLRDVDFFFDALDQFEQFLIRGYVNDIQPVTGGGSITQVFDRSRLMLVGFSNGGRWRTAWPSRPVRAHGLLPRSERSARPSAGGIARPIDSRYRRTPIGHRRTLRPPCYTYTAAMTHRSTR